MGMFEDHNAPRAHAGGPPGLMTFAATERDEQDEAFIRALDDADRHPVTDEMIRSAAEELDKSVDSGDGSGWARWVVHAERALRAALGHDQPA